MDWIHTLRDELFEKKQDSEERKVTSLEDRFTRDKWKRVGKYRTEHVTGAVLFLVQYEPNWIWRLTYGNNKLRKTILGGKKGIPFSWAEEQIDLICKPVGK